MENDEPTLVDKLWHSWEISFPWVAGPIFTVIALVCPVAFMKMEKFSLTELIVVEMVSLIIIAFSGRPTPFCPQWDIGLPKDECPPVTGRTVKSGKETIEDNHRSLHMTATVLTN